MGPARFAVYGIVLVTVGCHGPMPVSAPAAAFVARSCDFLPADAPPGDTLDVVVTGPVTSDRITRATTTGERFVFAGAYETLVDVACNGAAVPALADSWRAEEGGRWTFVLRTGARFWNGERVTAANVVESWRNNSLALADNIAASAEVVDDSTIRVSLAGAPILTLAEPRWAVFRTREGGAWPEGTGPWRLAQGAQLELRSARPGLQRVLRIHSASATSARDLIDAAAELVLTDDQAIASYAAARPGATSVPLAWDRVWALVIPWRSAAQTSASPADLVALQNALALDVGRGAARAPLIAPGTAPTTQCSYGADVRGRDAARVAYRDDDAIARAIAERVVGLAGIAAGERRAEAPIAAVVPEFVRLGATPVALPLGQRAYDDSVHVGSTTASIVSTSPREAIACAGPRFIPLLETRWHAVSYNRE